MSVVATLVLVCAVFATGYQLFQVAAAWRFLRRARRYRTAGGHLPPVTVLKPLKGLGIDLYQNLSSFCRQNYAAPVQIVFGVEDARDPAVAVVNRLRREFPDQDLVLAVGDGPGANRKVTNLQQMMAHARHDVLVMSDGDIRVRPDYLRSMVAPLADPDVGLTTCLYRGYGHFGVPSLLESLFINTDFLPMVLVAQWVQRFRYAYGASIAVRRAALDDIGGFGPLADYLADDYHLGNRVDAAGWRLVLLPYVVETVLDSETLGDVWRHQVRWARTYRVCQPIGWFCSIITHATLWGVVAAVVTGGSRLGLVALAAAISIRLLSLAAVLTQVGERETLRWLPLVPLKDLASSAIWLAAFLGRRVVWSGRVLTVENDGRMTDLTPLQPEPATAVAPGPPPLRAAGS
jgi:ceramide glucosyltransferase